jgi:hypothetical protein
MTGTSTLTLSNKVRRAKEQLDAHVRAMMEWHFDAETGCRGKSANHPGAQSRPVSKLHADVIINRSADPLLATKISFYGLHRNV